MGEVIAFNRPRKTTIRGAARAMVTEAMNEHKTPLAAIVIILANDGCFTLRAASYQEHIHDFDMYSRAEAVLTKEKMRLLD